jgi:hypothetical protein
LRFDVMRATAPHDVARALGATSEEHRERPRSKRKRDAAMRASGMRSARESVASGPERSPFALL